MDAHSIDLLGRVSNQKSSAAKKKKFNKLDSVFAKDKLSALRDGGPIPSGVTYLAQLMAHDLILSQPTGQSNVPFQNGIARPLTLSTVYGRGPLNEPHLYALNDDDPARGFRGKFRSGELRRMSNRNWRPVPVSYSIWDLPRERGRTATTSPSQPIVADIRNDSHPLIAQMTAVWMRFHNHVFDKLGECENEALLSGVEGDERSFLRFQLAQRVTRHTWWNVLDADVFPWVFKSSHVEDERREIRAKANKNPDKGQGQPDPLGTAEARIALRCLHALPRASYRLAEDQDVRDLKSILRIGGHGRVDRLNADWRVDWNLFFDRDVEQPALNRTRFRCSFVKPLRKQNDERTSIFVADLAREEKLLSPTRNRKISFSKSVRQALESDLRKAQIRYQATSAPLLLLFLKEAELTGTGTSKGERLGTQGSRVLAEWIIPAQEYARSSEAPLGAEKRYVCANFDGVLKALGYQSK